MLCQFFFSIKLSRHFRREKPVFLESIFVSKQELITHTSLVYKTLQQVGICLLITALNKEFCIFYRESYFMKAIGKIFPVFA